MMVATPAALAESNPIPGGSVSSWLGELTNQLVGRFKNTLLLHGVDVSMSIPVVLTASRIRPFGRHELKQIVIRVGSGTVTMWLEVDGDAQLAAPATPEPGCVEGDVMLF